MTPELGDFPVFMQVAFAVFGVFFLAVVGFIAWSAVRSRKVLRDAGLDPMAAHAQLTAGLARGPLTRQAASLESRLASSTTCAAGG
jgi:hypothetical protein